MKVLKLFIVLLSVLVFACTEKDSKKNGFPSDTVLEGKAENPQANGKVIVYRIEGQGGKLKVADTTTDEEGNFKVTVKNVKQEDFYLVNIYNMTETLIIMGDQNLEMNYVADKKRYIVSGSRDNDLLMEYQLYNYHVRDSVQRLNMTRDQKTDDEFHHDMGAIQDDFNKFNVDFMKRAKPSLASLLAIQTIVTNEKLLEENMNITKATVDELTEKYPHVVVLKTYKAKMQASSSLVSGIEAPEINLPDVDGKDVKLSSLRGKVVMIDFWASWCGPCRRENPNVVKLYNAYKDKGFEIFGVSLDREKDAWLKAIEKDGLTWVHVSDLKYWDSAAAKTYNITSIPATVLLDEDGKVIAKNLRGKALEDKLEEIFSNK